MMPSAIPKIRLGAQIHSTLAAAIDDLPQLLARFPLPLDLDRFPQLREFFVDGQLDISDFVHVHQLPAAGGADDVTCSFEPSERFLEFLAALRTGDLYAA